MHSIIHQPTGVPGRPASAMRAFSVIGVALAIAAAGVRPARAERVIMELDGAWPSGGASAASSRPASTWVEVDLGARAPFIWPSNSIADSAVLAATPTVGVQFDAMGQLPALDGFIEKPPDTHIAAGPGLGSAGRIVEVTNNGIAIYDKTGATLAGPIDLDAFVATTSGGFDSKVLYDQHDDVFWIVMLDGKTPNPGGTSTVHIAVSTTAVPDNLDTTGVGAHWNVLSASALSVIGGAETWFDYPGIGSDASRLVVTGNMFNAGGAFRGVKIRVYDKAQLIAGSNVFTDIDVDAAVLLGTFTVQPCHVFGTTDNGNFYLLNRFGGSAYRLWEITGPPGSPSLVAGTFDTLRTWSAGGQISANGASQAGVTGIEIDTLSARLMQATYRGGRIWTALSADIDSDSKTEVVWFEIATNGGNPAAPTIARAGFIDGSDGNEWTFVPSINVNAAGDVVVCYTQSFTDQSPDMRVVARRQSDPASLFGTPIVIRASAGEYDDFSDDDPERWGDYSVVVIDPSDDLTFWVASQFVATARSAGDDARWGTHIAQIQVTRTGSQTWRGYEP